MSEILWPISDVRTFECRYLCPCLRPWPRPWPCPWPFNFHVHVARARTWTWRRAQTRTTTGPRTSKRTLTRTRTGTCTGTYVKECFIYRKSDRFVTGIFRYRLWMSLSWLISDVKTADVGCPIPPIFSYQCVCPSTVWQQGEYTVLCYGVNFIFLRYSRWQSPPGFVVDFVVN